MEFSDKKLEAYGNGSTYPKNIPPKIRKHLSNKLLTLDAATSIEQLSIPPSNNLEKLSGNYEEYYSIRINKQYRLVFKWGEGKGERMSVAQAITNNRSHPGLWLKEEFLEPLHISAYRLAKDIGVQQSTITRLIHEQSRITPNLALRFEKYFSLDAEFWLNIQKNYDLTEARANEIIPEIKPFNSPNIA